MTELEAVPNRADSVDAWQTRLARMITEVFAPVILIFGLLIVVSLHATDDVPRGLSIGFLAAMFAGGLPYIVLILGVRSGRLDDRHLSRREERPIMMVMGLISVTCGLVVMRSMEAPRDVYALVAAMVAGVAVALAISLFWKISIHTACVAGSVATLIILVNPVCAYLTILVLGVGWARVVLRDHTPAQAVVGALVGATTATSVLLMF